MYFSQTESSKWSLESMFNHLGRPRRDKVLENGRCQRSGTKSRPQLQLFTKMTLQSQAVASPAFGAGAIGPQGRGQGAVAAYMLAPKCKKTVSFMVPISTLSLKLIVESMNPHMPFLQSHNTQNT